MDFGGAYKTSDNDLHVQKNWPCYQRCHYQTLTTNCATHLFRCQLVVVEESAEEFHFAIIVRTDVGCVVTSLWSKTTKQFIVPVYTDDSEQTE